MPNQNEDNGTGILTPWGRRFFSIVGLIALALLIAFVLSGKAGAAAPPMPPYSPYGIVTIDDAPVPDGTLITAYCGGSIYRSTLTTTHDGASWYFNLDVPGDDPETTVKDGCDAGEQVYFYVGGGIADQTATWVSGGSGRLDLSRSLTWDKSTLSLTGQCLADGRAEYTVTNGGLDMAGPSEWQLYGTPSITAGVFQLAAGESRVWTFGPFGYEVDFAIAQRPEHPGNSAPHLALACNIPTALTLTSFSATSGGNKGGCAPANKIRGLACTVTKFTPGYVSGTCDGGLTFSRVRTSRTFRLDQPVTAQGCIGGDGWQLTSAPGWPLRISR